jgi:DNA polymerase III subunit delta
MAELKPAYLIHGEDEGKIDPWRSRVRERAEEDSEATLMVLRDDRLKGETVAEEIGALTLSTGRRWVLIDGPAQKWKAGDVKEVAAALATLPAQTTVVFVVVGEAPKGLEKAVRECGGQVHKHAGPQPKGYRDWILERAGKFGLELDREAADVLLAHAPRNDKNRIRQQSVMRELEKLAIYVGEPGTVGADTVTQLSGSEAEIRMYELADAVVDGDRARALELAERLRSQGEDMIYILFALVRQIRDSRRAWAMANEGRSLGEMQSALRPMPSWKVGRLVSRVKNLDGEQFERAVDLLADLDWEIRGGGQRDQESALTLTLAGAAGPNPN